jgi:hypothetical protein
MKKCAHGGVVQTPEKSSNRREERRLQAEEATNHNSQVWLGCDEPGEKGKMRYREGDNPGCKGLADVGIFCRAEGSQGGDRGTA